MGSTKMCLGIMHLFFHLEKKMDQVKGRQEKEEEEAGSTK
jgi:hypothetical protein